MTAMQIMFGLCLAWQLCSALKNSISLVFNLGVAAFIAHYVLQLDLAGLLQRLGEIVF